MKNKTPEKLFEELNISEIDANSNISETDRKHEQQHTQKERW